MPRLIGYIGEFKWYQKPKKQSKSKYSYLQKLSFQQVVLPASTLEVIAVLLSSIPECDVH